MILMIDNYDSFTYNIVQYVGELGKEVMVKRNDEITIKEIEDLTPNLIMISPGPCTPTEAGISLEVIKYFAGSIPIFGVCLGFQAMAQAFGGNIVGARKLMHGKTSMIYHDGKTIFTGLTTPNKYMRYHSLMVEKQTLPVCFEVSAETDEGEIMAIRHKGLPMEGVQFHPESILSQEGKALIKNMLETFC